jgi:hypothetical protein
MSDDALRRATAKKNKADDDMDWMEAVLRLGDSQTHVEWRSQMHAIKGWSRPTFKRRLKSFKKRHPELAGGRWQGDPYSLLTQPTRAMAERVALLRTWLNPSGTFASRIVSLVEPEPIRAQVGSAGLRDLDLIAKARAHVKSTKME